MEQEDGQEVGGGAEVEAAFFGRAGESVVHIDLGCGAPGGADWVRMESDRPTPAHIATSAGLWVLPPAPVPASCTRRQGRLALNQLGFLDAAEAAIAAIEDPAERRAGQIEYEAETWERSNVFVQQLWTTLGGSPEGLDDAFRLAVTL
jgi:hypothetical protein